jgi:hypothetical protein
LLINLSKKNKITYEQSKTNEDYKREIEQNWPIQVHSFSNVRDQFDETWYGERAVSSEGYHKYQQQINQLMPKEEADETK